MRTGPSAKSHATQSFVAASAGSGAGAPAGARRYDPSSMLASGRPGRLGGTSSGRLHPKAKADAAAAGPSRKQMEDRKLQQLRGVFAAFDSDRDSILTKECVPMRVCLLAVGCWLSLLFGRVDTCWWRRRELANALMSLGINPTPKVIQKYQIGSTSGVIDLATFINVTMTRMQTAESTADQIMVLFKEFDPDGRGFVSAQVMQHLLHELDVSTALTPEESQDLLQMMGVLPKDAPGPFVAGSSVAVDYRQFIDKMIF